jgi:hypothetical protein
VKGRRHANRLGHAVRIASDRPLRELTLTEGGFYDPYGDERKRDHG